MRERNYIIDKVGQFEEKALLKNQYLTELYYWFEEHIHMVGVLFFFINPLPNNATFTCTKISSRGKHCEKRRNCL